jgi:hypothetical protein
LRRHSTQDDNSGLNPGLNFRTSRGEYFVGGRANGVRDVRVDVAFHLVYDAFEFNMQAVRASEWY